MPRKQSSWAAQDPPPPIAAPVARVLVIKSSTKSKKIVSAWEGRTSAPSEPAKDSNFQLSRTSSPSAIQPPVEIAPKAIQGLPVKKSQNEFPSLPSSSKSSFKATPKGPTGFYSSNSYISSHSNTATWGQTSGAPEQISDLEPRPARSQKGKKKFEKLNLF